MLFNPRGICEEASAAMCAAGTGLRIERLRAFYVRNNCIAHWGLGTELERDRKNELALETQSPISVSSRETRVSESNYRSR